MSWLTSQVLYLEWSLYSPKYRMVQIRSTSCYSDAYNAKGCDSECGRSFKNENVVEGRILNSFWRRGSPEKLAGMEPLSSLCDRILQMEMHEINTLIVKEYSVQVWKVNQHPQTHERSQETARISAHFRTLCNRKQEEDCIQNLLTWL